DDHRFAFRVIDVRRNDRAPARDLAPNEFGRNLARDIRAKGFASVLLAKIVCITGSLLLERTGVSPARTNQQAGSPLAPQARCLCCFANGDELHFWRDDSLARIPELRDRLAGRSA